MTNFDYLNYMVEILQLSEDAWKNFVKFYNKQYLNYTDGEIESGQNWVCWKEIDVMGHLMRFLFEEFQTNKINNIEIHLDCHLKPENFVEPFYSILKKLQTHFGRSIRVDMALAKEDRLPFELCLEAKHFHYSVEKISRGNDTVEGVISKDIKRLQAYKKFKIAKSIAFVVLDEYYYYLEPDKSEIINNILNQYKNEMLILYHHSP